MSIRFDDETLAGKVREAFALLAPQHNLTQNERAQAFDPESDIVKLAVAACGHVAEQLRTNVPEDYQLVPKSMSSEMFFRWTGTKVLDEGLPHERYQACYAAMFAGLPKTEMDLCWPVARVAEIHLSRYTVEWINGPLAEGTCLYGRE